MGAYGFSGVALPVIDALGEAVETALALDGGAGGVKLRFGCFADLADGPARFFFLAGDGFAGRGTGG